MLTMFTVALSVYVGIFLLAQVVARISGRS